MKTLFTGRQLIRTDSIDSTNNYAARLLDTTNVPEGTVILTRTQTSGKGQRGNTWLSEPGMNLTMSVILYPGFLKVDEQFNLSMAVSLSLQEALLQRFSDIHIKWPNDIYAGTAKLAGILIENSIENNRIKSSVVGIGMNVNQDDFPEGMNAVSLKRISGLEEDIDFWMERFCEYIEKNYLLIRAGKQNRIKEKYLESLMFYQQKRFFLEGKNKLEGRITDVGSDGKLIMETDEGVRRFDIKEITFLI